MRRARIIAGATIATALAFAACDDVERRALGTCCVGCGAVGWAVGESIEEQVTDDGPRCEPSCEEPAFCNYLLTPPRCSPPFAGPGELCGYVPYPRAEYECVGGVCATSIGRHLRCAEGLECAEGTCRAVSGAP